jgi:hypothetical protein
MRTTTHDFVKSYVAEMSGKEVDLERLVTTPSGLDPEGMNAAIGHPDVGRLGISMMADFMAPEGSIYYDAIFGAFHGQSAIRRWLVPAMADIEFIDFVTTAPPVIFDDGLGGTSLDEWQMVMNLDGLKIPLSRGVSVRRYRDGWITWACDVYDTAAFRQPPPPEMADAAAPPLPPVPRLNWSEGMPLDESTIANPREIRQPFHPTDSVYFDAIAGELRGQEAITTWLAEMSVRSDYQVFEPLGPLLFDGSVSVQEWKTIVPGPDGTPTTMRGTSVRRFADDFVVYAADYYDTATF